MKKFRDWMHGQGRPVIITAIVTAAICIVGNYFFVERGGHWGAETPTPMPTQPPIEETILGGESIGSAPEETPVPDSTAQAETSPEQSPDNP